LTSFFSSTAKGRPMKIDNYRVHWCDLRHELLKKEAYWLELTRDETNVELMIVREILAEMDEMEGIKE